MYVFRFCSPVVELGLHRPARPCAKHGLAVGWRAIICLQRLRENVLARCGLDFFSSPQQNDSAIICQEANLTLCLLLLDKPIGLGGR